MSRILSSGQADRIVFIDGDRAEVASSDEESRQRISVSEVGYLFAGCDDVVIYPPGTTRTEAVEKFRLDTNVDSALRLALIFLEVEAYAETRRDAAAALDDLLNDSRVFEAVRNSLSAAPLPAPAIEMLQTFKLPEGPLRGLFDEIRDLQPSIDEVRRRWDGIPSDCFSDDMTRERYAIKAAVRGVFYDMASRGAAGTGLLESYQKLADLPDYRDIVSRWASRLQIKARLPRKFHSVLAEGRKRPERWEYGSTSQGFDILANVHRQQDSIEGFIRSGAVDQALKYANELIAGQTSGTQDYGYAAKSLCSLAQRAKKHGAFALQLQWSQRATELAPEDPWAMGQLADAFIIHGRLKEAEQVLEKVVAHYPLFAKSNYARILRAQGDLDGAIAGYRGCIAEFPDEAEVSYAWIGWAETLRDQSSFDEALEVYLLASQRFGSDPRLRSGLGNLYADLARWSDALTEYGRAMRIDEADPSAYIGRANLYRRRGEYEEAINEYKETIKSFPLNSYVACGLAETYREAGLVDEAMDAFKKASSDFPFSYQAQIGLLECLRDQGRIADAISYSDEVAGRFSSVPQPLFMKAVLLRDDGQLRAALTVLDGLAVRFPRHLGALAKRADVLKRLQMLDAALQAYTQLLDRDPNHPGARISMASLLLALNRYDEVEPLLPTKWPPRTEAEWALHHVRGMMLIRAARYEDAVGFFETASKQVSFARQRSVFRSALALAHLKLRRFQEAVQTAEQSDEDTAKIVRFVAVAEERPSDAAELYPSLVIQLPDNLGEIVTAIAIRLNIAANDNSPLATVDESFDVWNRLDRAVLLEAA